jgi:hypothetical protein
VLAAGATVALLKWQVRWRFAAVTFLCRSAMPRRAAMLRRLPFALLAIAAASPASR